MADDKIVSIVGQGAIDELKELSRLLEQNVDLVVEFNNATKAGQLKIAGAESLTELNKGIEEAAKGLNLLKQSGDALARAEKQAAKERQKIFDDEAKALLKWEKDNQKAAESTAKAHKKAAEDRAKAHSKATKEIEKEAARERAAAEATRKELDRLAKDYERQQKQAAARAAKAEEKKRLQEEAAAARQFRKELAELEKQQKKAEAEAKKMESAYHRLNVEHRTALKTAKDLGAQYGVESQQFKEAADKANLLDQQLKKIDANLGQHQRNVGNYSSAYNGLGVSLGHIASELPNLSQGFGLFLRAIGNNIPEVIKGVKQLREENQRLNASGQQGTSIWKAFGQAIFSWQTLFLALTAVVISQGDKFIDWLTGVSAAAKESSNSIKDLTGKLEELENVQELQDTRLSNSVKVALAKAEAEGKSEEEQTKILQDEINKRIANQEDYNKKLEELAASQLHKFEVANKAAADASFITSADRIKIADDELNELRKVNEKVAKGKIDLENLKSDLEVGTYHLKEQLRKRDEKEQEKANAREIKRLEKQAALREQIMLTRLSFKTKPGMDELEATAQGIGQGATSPTPGIISEAQQTERNKKLLQLESDFLDEQSAITNTHFKNKQDQEKALTASQIKYAQDRYQIERAALDEQMALLPADSEERLQFLVQANAKELELYQALNEAKIKDDEKAAAQRKAIEEKVRDTVVQLWNMAAAAYADFAQRKANDNIELIDREIEANERAADIEIKKIEVSAKTAEEKEKMIQGVEADTVSKRIALEEKQKGERRKAASAQKAATISQIIMSTAQAVMAALSAVPYTPLNAVNAIAAGAIGAAQLAIAASAPLPQYAEGTQHHRGGAFIAGEAGERELVVRPDNKAYWTDKVAGIYNEPKGTRVIPESKLYSMPALGGGLAMQKKGDTINVFDDKRIVRAINNNKPVVNINVSNGSKVKHWTA